MKSILDACEPRDDILKGSFNPEIFTAMLSQVIAHYVGERSRVDSIYTDGNAFFEEATFPTDGLRLVLGEVFGRIAGDASLPAIHRLETAFGGGKTHALIACTHLAYRGKSLAESTDGIVDSKVLPDEGEVAVVGVAGDELPVHQPAGEALTPYTLWGEIAFQVGGEALYREVETEVASFASPGKHFFEKVFGGRKALVMLDELAQYSARLEAARTGGAEQLAAFLMSLHGYARSHEGISVILTLAGKSDAFSGQTHRLQTLISSVKGEEVSPDEALETAERGERGIRSVVARDATSVVPVQASEISRVLAKRLFSKIDQDAARKAAEAYMELYAKNQSSLPDTATRADFRDRMAGHYPFHPTFIDFLTNKLSAVENFQGTRGVLRVLAYAVREIWNRRVTAPMIHACHLNLRDARTVNEILGRTGAGDLLNVLNADVGGVDSSSIEGGKSNAELADEANPHPDGYPMHEYTWKTVFLHSLVGRDEGLGSNLFGITESESLFSVSFPGLTPPQVATALKEIENRAYYLREREGRYFASLDPSVNQALARIRRSIGGEDIQDILATTARKVVKSDLQTFAIHHDVTLPEQIPDQPGKPHLALISLDAEELKPDDFLVTAGENKPRQNQNTVLLLVPGTAGINRQGAGEDDMFDGERREAEKARNRLQDLARWVLAMRRLEENPRNYGISQNRLKEQDFDARKSEREQALVTAVSESYSHLWYPAAAGALEKEIKASSAEGGASVIEVIRQALIDEGQFLTAEHKSQADLLNLGKLFFSESEVISVEEIRKRFASRRSWPMLESPSVLDQLIRAGVEHGNWHLYRMGDAKDTKPSEIYSRDENPIPLGLDIGDTGWSLVNPSGAKKRGWIAGGTTDPSKLRNKVREVITSSGEATVEEVTAKVRDEYGVAADDEIGEAIVSVLQEGRASAYSGKKSQEKKPEKLISGSEATFHKPGSDDVIITQSRAAEKGWTSAEDRTLRLEGDEAMAKLRPLLKRLGSLYGKGAKSTIDVLQLAQLKLPGGGMLDLTLSEATPESMKQLGELLETLDEAAEIDDGSDIYLEIKKPEEGCKLVEELKKKS